jgi:hypothetical protein
MIMKYHSSAWRPRELLSLIYVCHRLILRNRDFILHIMMLQIKKITSVMKVLTYIITSIRACTFRLTTILTITCVSTFKTDIILWIFSNGYFFLYMNIHDIYRIGEPVWWIFSNGYLRTTYIGEVTGGRKPF